MLFKIEVNKNGQNDFLHLVNKKWRFSAILSSPILFDRFFFLIILKDASSNVLKANIDKTAANLFKR